MNPAGPVFIPWVTAFACVACAEAFAFDFGQDDGVHGFWTTTANMGVGFRARNADPMLIKRENGTLLGIPDASGGGADDANLNYGQRGDNFSTVAKVFTDLDLRYRNFGVVLRGKLWYDYELENRGVPHGSTNNAYIPDARLSDQGFEREAKFSGATLGALFAYGRFEMRDSALDVRIGQQAVLSGLGIGRYLRGISLNMPLDVPAIRRVGYLEALPLRLPMGVFEGYVQDASGRREESRVALWQPLGSNTGYWDPEAPIPTGAIAANLELFKRASVSAFYQYQWRPTVTSPCGTYFAGNDLNTDPSASATCFAVQYGQATPGGTTIISERDALAQRRFIRMIGEQLPKDGGQYGATLWLPLDIALSDLAKGANENPKPLQIGFHFLNLDSTLPMLDGIRGAPGQLYDFQPLPAQGRWVYPESVRTYGISARIDPAIPRAWMLNAELSYVPNAPVQINANDLLYASVSNGAGPAGPRVSAVDVGRQLTGYDRVGKTQLIANGGVGFADAEQRRTGFLFAETGFQWAHLPQNGLRYGRAFMYGIAPGPGIDPSATICVQAPGNAGCSNEGFFTHFSWGYRLKLVSGFENVLKDISLRPSLAFVHDVKGYSIDNQLIEGRKYWDVSLRFDRAGSVRSEPARQQYYLDVKYVAYSRSAKFDSLRDRNYIAASLGATF